MQKLPVGIPSFERIREGDYLYIDKTKWIHHLVDQGMYYFLSRPRRFGKSLLMSTLRCLYEGRRELFKGLWIEDKWSWDKKYPVIKIDFNVITSDTAQKVKQSLEELLEKTAAENQLKLSCVLLAQKFQELVLKLKEKFQENVVFLIDEYDKPIINHLGRGEEHLNIAKENREVLKEFYGVIKDVDVASVTQFVLLTGVSKFSKMSVFSELNNLEDISMAKDYSVLLGITEKEIDQSFSSRLREFAEKRKVSQGELRKDLRNYYNGYCFASKGEKVYNPFSFLRCLKEREFKNYWFESGTPTFLLNLIKENEYQMPDIENLRIPESWFSQYELEDLRIEALLFQTGYITIKEFDGRLYRLGYPNQEVKLSFSEHLFYHLSNITDSRKRAQFYQIEKTLKDGNMERFIEIVKVLFAGISYPLSCKQNEAYFHSLFYLMVSGAGVFTETEVLTSEGRIDLVVYLKDKIYLMEFKCGQSSKKAIEQIMEKKYPQKYQNLNKPIHLLGINFSQETRNITDWQSA